MALSLSSTLCIFSQIGLPRVVIAEGGPYAASDSSIQHFHDQIHLPEHYANLPLSLVCTNGSMQALGFSWVRVFLQPGASDENVQSSDAESGRLLVDEHTFEGRTQVYLDLTGQLNAGRNRLYIEGAGPAGAVFSWELRSEGAPVLSRFNPTCTISGASLLIGGFGFSNRPAENVVHLGSLQIPVMKSTFKRLKLAVPPGFPSGTYPLSVSVAGYPSNTIKMNVLTGPEVDGLEYSTMRSGQTMAIYGKNFSTRLGDNIVYLGNKTATVVASSETTISVVVPNLPAGITNVSVIVNGAVAKGTARLTIVH